MDSVLADLVEIIAEETGLPAADILPTHRFADDLDLDPLGVFTIITLAEDKLKRAVADADIRTIQTVGDAATLLADLV
ncbi:MAG: phosphopantetheine-binding protein [Micrococcales bacterium]|nr:phosphopantetheine-binding protein [Micrococcales bacterium]